MKSKSISLPNENGGKGTPAVVQKYESTIVEENICNTQPDLDEKKHSHMNGNGYITICDIVGDDKKYGENNYAYSANSVICDVTPPPSYHDVGSNRKDTFTSDVADDEQNKEIDPWELVAPPSTGKPWDECSTAEKIGRVIITIIKILSIVLMLYLFICSIDILGASFQILGGRTAGAAFKSELMQNPICALCIGIAVTAVLQSSSTSTSIVVTMVAANILSVEQGIYIIMGANIGTAITSGIVALSQVAEKNQFRRAFASSMLLYIFNMLTVIILLPLEYMTGYLNHLTLALVQGINVDTSNPNNPQFLKVITQPFTHFIIQVDKDVISAIAEDVFKQKRPLTKYLCSVDKKEYMWNYKEYDLNVNVTEHEEYLMVKNDKTHPGYWSTDESVVIGNRTNGTLGQIFSWAYPSFNSSKTKHCNHLFVGAGLPSEYDVQDGWPHVNLSDEAVGAILVCISLISLCGCLIGMVKILSSLLQGSLLKTVRKSVNADFPCGRFGKELAGYVAILLGMGLTILVQSSSVFTAALNPLAGMGIVALDRVYPLTIGASIGTTITSILAAFTSEPETIRNALQCAFAHFFFNVTGTLLFYPLPFMRKLPMYLSMQLGNITADYKWFAVFFLAMTYFVIPLVVLALSIPGIEVFLGVMVPLLTLIVVIIIINRMQTKCPSALPKRLQTWDCCPLACHSLDPYDKLVKKFCRCKMCNEELPPEKNAMESIVLEVVADTNLQVPEDSDKTLEKF